MNMRSLLERKLFLVITTLSLAVMIGGSALGQKIRVVTSIPDLADIARQIGKDRVSVESLTLGIRNIHSVPMKPSMVTKLNRADVLIVMGLYMEHAFLPALLSVATNPRISPQGIGYIDTSRGITPIDVPTTLSRQEGDVHPMGSPHYNLDPVLGKLIARNIAEGLSNAYVEQRPFFMKNLAAYTAELDRLIPEWQRIARPLNGVKFVSYHEDLGYFARRFGMQVFGTMELRPGIAPTPAHIVQLVQRMKAEKVPLVLYTTYPSRIPDRIASETGAKALQVPSFVGGEPGVDTYIKLINYLVTHLAKAVS
jgi:zinc/manganese transport system substrate-binding protein